MVQTGGIEGEPSPKKIHGPSSTSPEGQAENIQGLLTTPIHSLNQMKEVLIQHLGPKEGKKFYETFMKSIVMMMLETVRRSADQATQAAKKMSGQGGG